MCAGRPAVTVRRMSTRSRLAVAAALSTGAAGLLVHPGGGQAQSGQPTTLTLRNRALQVKVVDLPPRATRRRPTATAGDELHATSRVTGSATGRRYVTCSVTARAASVESARYACQIDYTLADGTITAAGTGRVGADGPVTVAVTGGTGAYAGAGGTAVSKNGTDTLELLP